MRKPTTSEERWHWWELAVQGEAPAFREDEPQCGFFKMRKFRYGLWTKSPWIPARVWLEPGEIDPATNQLLTDEFYRMELDGCLVNPLKFWTWIAKNPITLEEWEFLTAMSPLIAKRIPQTA